MLGLLRDYAQQQNIALEPGFGRRYAKWAIVCDSEGRYIHSIRLGDASVARDPGREFPISPELTQSQLVSGTEGARSHFLIESAKVVVGLGQDLSARDVKKHGFFVGLLAKAGEDISEFRIAASCLQDEGQLEKIRADLREQKCSPNDNVTLQVDGMFLVDSNSWHKWWREFMKSLTDANNAGKKSGKPDQKMRCFVTGELVVPARTHAKVNLASVGGISSGSTVIGFDKDAFCSYGLKQSANAAVSADAAAAYRAGLNHLLEFSSHTLVGAKVAHWYKESIPEEDDPMLWLDPDSEQEGPGAKDRAQKLLQAIKHGERPNLAMNHYYAVTISGTSGRAMFRDWMEGSFESLVGNIKTWFDDLALVDPYGGGMLSEPKMGRLLRAMARSASSAKDRQSSLQEVPTPVVASMWRVAVGNEIFPPTVMYRALRYWRSEILTGTNPDAYRIALLKACQNRWTRVKGGRALTERLDESHPDKAYQCGRLMATMAAIQRSALGDVGANVVQRYYAAASSTPALVLGRLTRVSQFHLGKLSKGLAYWYESILSEIWTAMGDDLPATLTLEQQSMFALGYYQQLAALRTKREKPVLEEVEVDE